MTIPEKVNDMINTILKHEGGYVDDPDDKGGATNFGITHAVYSRFLKKQTGKEATKDDVKNMPVEHAIEIYTDQYYFEPKVDELPETIQEQALDMCVNHGPRNAMRILQRAGNQINQAKIEEDGRFGPNTKQCIVSASDKEGQAFNNVIADQRADFYRRIVENNASQGKFLKGWLRRAESFKTS